MNLFLVPSLESFCSNTTVQVVEVMVVLRGPRGVNRYSGDYEDGIRQDPRTADSQCSDYCKLRCVPGGKQVLRGKLQGKPFFENHHRFLY